MSSPICLTCSSSILPSSIPTVYLTPCCSTPICSPCLQRNPRLKEYIPCLRCGDLTTAEGSKAASEGRRKVEADRRAKEAVFEIGDDDEDDAASSTSGAADVSKSEDSIATMPDGGDMAEEEMEVVEVRHPVARGDTLLSIARRYAADPHELITLNSLPPSILSTQPHLLRTRRTLLISRRLVPKSSVPNEALFDSGLPEDPLAVEKRERERAVKRFQLLTKTVDPGVGAAYLGLSQLDEDVLDSVGEGMEGKKAPLPEVGNREERALEAFYDDEQWERAAGGPSRGGLGRWRQVGQGSTGIKI